MQLALTNTLQFTYHNFKYWQPKEKVFFSLFFSFSVRPTPYYLSLSIPQLLRFYPLPLFSVTL